MPAENWHDDNLNSRTIYPTSLQPLPHPETERTKPHREDKKGLHDMTLIISSLTNLT